MPTESGKLSEVYKAVRTRTETLCKPLEIEDFIPQPSVDVSPPKWHIAHTTWFFEEMILKLFLPNYIVFDDKFAFLFNSYYNSLGDRTVRENRGDLSRPTVKSVFAYRAYVDENMLALLATDISPEIHQLVVLGINHEQQHQELLLTDLKYTFSQNPLMPVYDPHFAEIERRSIDKSGFFEMSEGLYDIGFNGDGFHFDNELGHHKIYLHKFSIAQRLVTNAEFIEFIDTGGYEDFRYWHSEGWDWVSQNDVKSPQYWNKIDSAWHNFTLGGNQKLDLDAPATHISFYEAAAYAEFRGMRLPTEFEWEAAAGHLDWGLRWEWTNSAYLPYPGFAKASGAVGEYNGKFMINQMVLRGASIASPQGHSRQTYRNFFHPHLRWQFTGLRLAK